MKAFDRFQIIFLKDYQNKVYQIRKATALNNGFPDQITSLLRVV